MDVVGVSIGPVPTQYRQSPNPEIAGKPNRLPTRNQSVRYRDSPDWSGSVGFVGFLCCFSDSIPSRPDTDSPDSRLAGKRKPTPDPSTSRNRNREAGMVGIGTGGGSRSGMLSPSRRNSMLKNNIYVIAFKKKSM